MYVYWFLCVCVCVPVYIYGRVRVHHSLCVCVFGSLICGNAFISGRRETSEKYFGINNDCILRMSYKLF